MMETLAALGKKRATPESVRAGSEQLDLAITGGEERGPHSLVADLRLPEQREPERVAPEPVGLRERFHDDAHVVDLPNHTVHTVARPARGIQADSSP